jgi:NADH:ubiquinone oxidoreductase subunit 3 (subunit A)
MAKWFLLPPVTFIVVLLISTLLSKMSKVLAFKDHSLPGGKYKSYACGENVDQPRVQPGYEQFFPFAFFFTIMHVVALVIATAPIKSFQTVLIVALFIMAAISGLFILFRK